MQFADFAAAAEYFRWFVNCGREETKDPGPQLISWQQDAQEIVADVNKVAGQEIRSLPFLHWWTFLGGYMEIGECTFSTIVSIRSKKAKGKKLEKWEEEFYREHYEMIKLPQKYTKEEQELLALFE